MCLDLASMCFEHLALELLLADRGFLALAVDGIGDLVAVHLLDDHVTFASTKGVVTAFGQVFVFAEDSTVADL